MRIMLLPLDFGCVKIKKEEQGENVAIITEELDASLSDFCGETYRICHEQR
jgi:hypothetical protein